MKSFIKQAIAYIKSRKEKQRKRDIEYNVNSDIVVKNDINDPGNGIYVYVCGIPVARICESGAKENNGIAIKDMAVYVSNIKSMYRNQLNGKAVNGK